MSVFLIDYENVRTSAFNGLEDLDENDRVIIFYTNNSDNLTFSLMQRLTESRAAIEYKKVSCGGKNSLDFQLCSYLGYLIGKSSDTRFCIVSRDKGFFTMLSLWGEKTPQGNSVICCANLSVGSVPDDTHQGDSHQEEPQSVQPDAPEESTEHGVSEMTANETSSAEATASEQAEIPSGAAPENTAPAEEKEAEPKPRRRRTYKRKPKAPAGEQSA